MNDIGKVLVSQDIWYVLLALVAAAVVSCAATPVVKVLSVKFGAVDVPKDGRRMHDHPIPRMGGLAIFFGFLAAVLVFVTLTDAMNPLVFFLGYMGLKVTAYLQPITHKLCNRLFREEDPIPLSEEELAAQEGEIPAGQ